MTKGYKHKNPRKRAAAVDRFWKHVHKADGCWLWTGAFSRDGYGKFWMVSGERMESSHRASWELANGTIPAGMFVCHRCDVRACVNPAHLFVGTATDNARDMAAKGRNSLKHRKLSDDDVREIRRRYAAGGVRQKDLAMEFGVEQTNVSFIIRRATWKGLDNGISG